MQYYDWPNSSPVSSEGAKLKVDKVHLVETTPKGFVLLSTPAKPTLFEALS